MIQLDIEHFLKEYWQKKPLLIRKGLPQFEDPLDEHDLAGLAQYPEVDSRIISSNKARDWNAIEGPFEDFEPVCQNHWSLLVRGVNEYLHEAAYLLDEFNFIPNWRVDDLMVSFSVENAGVGPHIDQYDVFIIQGKGKRNWKVGNKGEYREIHPHPSLAQIEPFEPIIDEVLEAGDIIYIPPGFPHDGIALEDCLNYSVGFRAPEQNQLLDTFATYLLEHQIPSTRYSDPEIKKREYSAEIKTEESEKLRELMLQSIHSPAFENWLLHFTSNQHNEETEPEDISHEDAQKLFNEVQLLEKKPDTIAVFLEQTNPGELSFAINGQDYSLQGNEQEIGLVKTLLSSRQFEIDEEIRKSEPIKQLLISFLMLGMWEAV